MDESNERGQNVRSFGSNTVPNGLGTVRREFYARLLSHTTEAYAG
jgi:hypothetical protein